MAAGGYRSLHHNRSGIYNRMHSKLMAGLGHMGLQRHPRQPPGPDMPTVFCVMAAGIAGRYRTG